MTGCLIALGIYYLGGMGILGIFLESLGIPVSVETLFLLPLYFTVGIVAVALLILLIAGATGKIKELDKFLEDTNNY